MGRMIKTYLAVLLLAAAPLRAEDFDYYLLALSWSPSFCAANDDPEQCAPDRDLGFILHGLWPQYESGWPEYCTTSFRDPSRRETSAMADVMGTGGLAWYQWKKHGRCSGLTSEKYFGLSRILYEGLELPVPKAATVTADGLEAAFLRGNPALTPDSVIVTCDGRGVQEVRICLGRDFEPRACGADVRADACRARGALDMPPAP